MRSINKAVPILRRTITLGLLGLLGSKGRVFSRGNSGTRHGLAAACADIAFAWQAQVIRLSDQRMVALLRGLRRGVFGWHSRLPRHKTTTLSGRRRADPFSPLQNMAK